MLSCSEEGGEVRKVVCARETDPTAVTQVRLDRFHREQQFLLQAGRSVKVTGARALSCAFIDEDPSDNQGGLELRITESKRR